MNDPKIIFSPEQVAASKEKQKKEETHKHIDVTLGKIDDPQEKIDETENHEHKN